MTSLSHKVRLMAVVFLMTALPAMTEPWGGRLITLTPATAIRIVSSRTIVSSFIVQMDACSTCGLGYLLYAPASVTCSNGGAGTTLIAKLAPGTATTPGGNVTVPSNPDPQGGVDLGGYCVDGSAAAPVIVSWNIRN